MFRATCAPLSGRRRLRLQTSGKRGLQINVLFGSSGGIKHVPFAFVPFAFVPFAFVDTRYFF
jgi:hypothetical protein